jgi:formate hydrogenlyase subunit 3/multisubunit Na+/H+ antiporter MnhD subunit
MLILLAVLSLLVFAVPRKFKYGFTLGVVSFGAVIAALEAVRAFVDDFGSTRHANSYNRLFGNDYPAVDTLSALFLVIIAIAAVSVVIYSRDYIKPYLVRKSDAHLSVHYLALAGMFFAMVFVVTFRGGFSFLFSWELMTLASFALILFGGEKREVRRAAINYLLLMHVGFVVILAAFAIASQDGPFDGFESLPGYFSANNPLPLFVLFLIGFGMKAGLFPLHVWLPEAHPAAPSHVSALMSGVMIKMGVYGVLRVLTTIHTDLYTIGMVILAAGIVTALWGILFAALQNDLKKLLAYSSIENTGIIFTAVGVATIGLAIDNVRLSVLCMAGALLHTVNHSLFKPMLFMGAGSIQRSTHTRNLDELGGLFRKMPVSGMLFLVAALAICALPPFNGFVSEFLMYLGLYQAIGAQYDVLVSVLALASLALVGGLAVLVFTKAFGIAFLGVPRCNKAGQAREASGWMIAGQVLPLAAIVLIGLFPAPFAQGVMRIVGQSFTGREVALPTYVDALIGPVWNTMIHVSAVALIFVGIACAIYCWKRALLKKRTVAEGPTWGCGFTAPDKRMQYTGESFAEGMHELTASLTASPKKEQAVDKDEIFARPRQFGIKRRDRIDSVVSTRWVQLMQKINARMALFQTGKINHYVLHALVFLALVLLLSFTGIIS